MPTFLTNPKMSEALAARVRASVRASRRGHGARASAPLRTALLRAFAVAFFASIGLLVWREQEQRAAQLADAKRTLLNARDELRSTLTPNAHTLASRIRVALRRESNVYAGPLQEGHLRQQQDWDALWQRRLIYARLPTDSANQPDKLDSVLGESKPDEFVLCLMQPSDDPTEKGLMKRLNAINGDPSTTKRQLLNVHPAFDALVVLQLLDPEFLAPVHVAKELGPVMELQETWDKARLEERLPAVFAEVLIAVLDEPKVANTPVELDGESVHAARVVIIDLSRDQDQVLFRARYDLDPSWVSERRRHQYSRALDSCRMASEIRLGNAAPGAPDYNHTQ